MVERTTVVIALLLGASSLADAIKCFSKTADPTMDPSHLVLGSSQCPISTTCSVILRTNQVGFDVECSSPSFIQYFVAHWKQVRQSQFEGDGNLFNCTQFEDSGVQTMLCACDHDNCNSEQAIIDLLHLIGEPFTSSVMGPDGAPLPISGGADRQMSGDDMATTSLPDKDEQPEGLPSPPSPPSPPDNEEPEPKPQPTAEPPQSPPASSEEQPPIITQDETGTVILATSATPTAQEPPAPQVAEMPPAPAPVVVASLPPEQAVNVPVNPKFNRPVVHHPTTPIDAAVPVQEVLVPAPGVPVDVPVEDTDVFNVDGNPVVIVDDGVDGPSDERPEGVPEPDGTMVINTPQGPVDVAEGQIDGPEGPIGSPEGPIDSPEGPIDGPEGSISIPEGSDDSREGQPMEVPEGAMDSREGSEDGLVGHRM